MPAGVNQCTVGVYRNGSCIGFPWTARLGEIQVEDKNACTSRRRTQEIDAKRNGIGP